MQDYSPLVAADFLAKVKKTRYKFEIYVGAAWVNLCDLNGVYYLKTISVNLSGAGATPDVIAGTWSAEIHNPGGIFHPLHPTSGYKDYFRIGRKVRISIGGVFGGTIYYWRRLTGYMDAPTFNHKSRSVSLSGCDSMKALADTRLTSPNNYWGGTETFSTVASVATLGSELYTHADAIKYAGEANNMTDWVGVNGAVSSVIEEGGGSNYVGQIYGNVSFHDTSAYLDPVFSVTAGKMYKVDFKYCLIGGQYGKVTISKSGGGIMGFITNLTEFVWTAASFYFVATETGTTRVGFEAHDPVGARPKLQIDLFSVKEVTAWTNTRYNMPAACNGPYYATLDGVPHWYGDDNQGWFYDKPNQIFYFVDNFMVDTGTNNLVVYYFTTQDIVNVLADVLAEGPGDAGGGAGLYANRAAALAALSYTDPAITVPKAWFEPGPALDAVRRICERCNYRFWFDYDGTPTFKPAPVAGEVDFSFTSFGHLGSLDDHQDLAQIRNRVVIEGIEQGAFSTAKDKKTTRLTGTASDGTSIAAYLEHTETITNDFFQDQDSIDAMCAVILARRKDPKWYASLTVPHCAVPLEIGDCIAWNIAFTPGGTPQTVTGIIVGIDLQNAAATYTCEIWQAPPLSSPLLSSPLRYLFRLFPGPRFLGLNA